MNLWHYISGHRGTLTLLTYQHASLCFQTVLVDTVMAVVLAVAVYRLPILSSLTLTLTSSRAPR